MENLELNKVSEEKAAYVNTYNNLVLLNFSIAKSNSTIDRLKTLKGVANIDTAIKAQQAVTKCIEQLLMDYQLANPTVICNYTEEEKDIIN